MLLSQVRYELAELSSCFYFLLELNSSQSRNTFKVQKTEQEKGLIT